MPSHFTLNSQKHKYMLLFCCFIILLPICLRIKYVEKLSLDAKEVTMQRLKLRHKNRSTVTNNRVWKVIVLHHHVSTSPGVLILTLNGL